MPYLPTPRYRYLDLRCTPVSMSLFSRDTVHTKGKNAGVKVDDGHDIAPWRGELLLNSTIATTKSGLRRVRNCVGEASPTFETVAS